MATNLQTDRIERFPARVTSESLDDSVVLRLSRTSLKAEPPVVRFVERVSPGGSQQRTLWPA
jgi:hypothetical protein